MASTTGYFSFPNGFRPNPRPAQLSSAHAALVRRARRDLEGTFDRLVAEGRLEDAAWILEHLSLFE